MNYVGNNKSNNTTLATWRGIKLEIVICLLFEGFCSNVHMYIIYFFCLAQDMMTYVTYCVVCKLLSILLRFFLSVSRLFRVSQT